MGKKAGNSAKFGRGSRSPSSKAYRSGSRWLINKAKRIKRSLRLAAKHKIKLMMAKPKELIDYAKLQELRQVVSQNKT